MSTPALPVLAAGLRPSPIFAVHDQHPTTSDFKQYNGRLDADVTSKDYAAFAIYWVPLANTTRYNGGLRDQPSSIMVRWTMHSQSSVTILLAEFPELSACQRGRMALQRTRQQSAGSLWFASGFLSLPGLRKS